MPSYILLTLPPWSWVWWVHQGQLPERVGHGVDLPGQLPERVGHGVDLLPLGPRGPLHLLGGGLVQHMLQCGGPIFVLDWLR